jgi:hypothetical protein
VCSSAAGGGTSGTARAPTAGRLLSTAAGGFGPDALSIYLSLRALVCVYHVLFVISRQYSRHMSASHYYSQKDHFEVGSDTVYIAYRRSPTHNSQTGDGLQNVTLSPHPWLGANGRTDALSDATASVSRPPWPIWQRLGHARQRISKGLAALSASQAAQQVVVTRAQQAV